MKTKRSIAAAAASCFLFLMSMMTIRNTIRHLNYFEKFSIAQDAHTSFLSYDVKEQENKDTASDPSTSIVSFDKTKATHVLRKFKTRQEYTIHTKVEDSKDLVQSDNTIVSAYFRFRSKYPAEYYDVWMERFLSVQDNMVIFLSGDKELIDKVWSMRQHALDRTVIVEVELESLPIVELGLDGFWDHQHDIDRQKKHHKSSHVYWIWLSKSWFVNQAIQLNFYQSDLYMWADIGSFRFDHNYFRGKTVIQHPSQLPDGRIMFSAIKDYDPPLNPIWNDKHRDLSKLYTSGAQIVGRKNTWPIYHDKFCETIDLFIDYGLFLGEDQAVLQATCNLNDLCVYVRGKEADWNSYFALRAVMHRDKKFNYTYPNVLEIPSSMEKSTCGYNYCENQDTASVASESDTADTNGGAAATKEASSEALNKAEEMSGSKLSVIADVSENDEVASASASSSSNKEQDNKDTTSDVVDTSSKAHHCLNDDFTSTHKTSVWTMLNDNPAYIESALKLGRALKKQTSSIDFDLVVMTLETKPLSEESMKKLSEIGFVNCVVQPIRPIHLEGKTRGDLTEKFGVLHVFAMTIYETVLFLDADTFVNGPIDDLLQMDLGDKIIGVTKDIRARKWVDTFNTGVMLLHPSENDYNHLTEKLMDVSFTFEYIMADQGFLNAVYENDWHEIGFVNNANLAVYSFQREFWDQYKLEDLRIIHYTMQKPWRCGANGPYGPICQVWIDAD